MDALTRLHRSLAGGDDEQPEDAILGDTEGLCSLSPLQRVYGFAACLVAGLALMILSLLVFARPIKFAVMFTFGNIMAVGSTAFLMGPNQQLRMMLDPVRVYATAIYVGCVVLALIFALWVHDKLLTLIAVIFEICALFCSARNMSLEGSRSKWHVQTRSKHRLTICPSGLWKLHTAACKVLPAAKSEQVGTQKLVIGVTTK